VTTYADLDPAAPRHAGAVLSACDDPSVPWHRIVRANGSLAKGDRQRRLLVAEGVPFAGERVDMRAAWVPPA
jgi:alkylated DNA nucleotide flippase Atl1